MISQQKKHKRITPMPVVSSFPPPNREIVHSDPVEYTLTPEQLAEVIAKYGPPKMPLREAPRSHYMSGKKGVEKNGEKQVRSEKDAS